MALRRVRRSWPAGLAVAVVSLAVGGCEHAFSDVATRIRYALLRSLASPPAAGVTTVLRLRPDHWPDACPGDGGYTLTVTPYRGGKQVRTGDIAIRCRSGHPFWTGLGSEAIAVAGDLRIEKARDEDLEIVLRGRASGIEIIELR